MDIRTHPRISRARNLGESKPRNSPHVASLPSKLTAQEAPFCYKTSPYLVSFDSPPPQARPAVSGSFSPSSAMAGGNLFARALSYVVNEFLVEGLANK